MMSENYTSRNDGSINSYTGMRSGQKYVKFGDKDIVKFKLLTGRDNYLEKFLNVPKNEKEEEKKRKLKYQVVDYKEFLPNSVVRSPLGSVNSNTQKTKKLNLYKMEKQLSTMTFNEVHQSSKSTLPTLKD